MVGVDRVVDVQRVVRTRNQAEVEDVHQRGHRNGRMPGRHERYDRVLHQRSQFLKIIDTMLVSNYVYVIYSF